MPLMKAHVYAKVAMSFAMIAVLITVLSTTFSNPSQASSSVASAATPVVAGNWPKDFELVYCWGTSDFDDIGAWCPCAELTLHKRPKDVDVFDCGTGNTFFAAGTWSKTRRWSTVTFDFGTVIYSGTKQVDGTFRGTMLSSSGIMGVWEGEFIR